MGCVIPAIYEGGVLRPLEKLDLPEHQHVQITVEPDVAAGQEPHGDTDQTDPLEGVRVATGIPDLAERFDDYRFGRRTP